MKLKPFIVHPSRRPNKKYGRNIIYTVTVENTCMESESEETQDDMEVSVVRPGTASHSIACYLDVNDENSTRCHGTGRWNSVLQNLINFISHRLCRIL